MVADGEEAELVLYHVAAAHPRRSVIASPQRVKGEVNVLECVFASFYARLRLRVSIQSSYNHLRISFGFRELGFCLLVIDSGC